MISSFTKTMNVGAALKPAKGSTKRIEPIADQLASLIGTYVKSYRSRMLVNNFFDELLVDDDGNFAEFGRIVWSKTDPIFQKAQAEDSDDAGAAVGKVDGRRGDVHQPRRPEKSVAEGQESHRATRGPRDSRD